MSLKSETDLYLDEMHVFVVFSHTEFWYQDPSVEIHVNPESEEIVVWRHTEH